MNELSREIEIVANSFDMSEEEESRLLDISRHTRESLENLSATNEMIEEHFHELVQMIIAVKNLVDSTVDLTEISGRANKVELF